MQNESSKQNNNPSKHETNVPAILILILVTVVVSIGVLSWSQSVDLKNPQANVVPQESSSPQAASYVKTKQVETTNDLPAGLLTSGTDLRQNRQVDLGSRKQRVVVFDSNEAPQNLADQYRRWLQDNGYRITSQSVEQDSVSFVGDSNGEQIILVLSRQAGNTGSRVQLSYVTSLQ